MSNILETSDIRVPFLAEVEANLNVIANGTTQYNKNWVGGHGDTMQIIVPTYGNTVGTGADVTSNISDAQGAKKDVTIKQYNKAVSLTSIEQSLDLHSYEDQIAKPFGQKMASDIQTIAVDMLAQEAGTATVSNTGTYAVIGDAVANLESSRAGGEIFGIMSPKIAKSVVDSGLSFFQASLEKSFTTGSLGSYLGCKWSKSQDAGTPLITSAFVADDVAVNQGTAYVAGATTLNIDATTLSGTYKKNQIIYVAGVNAVDVYGKDAGVAYPFILTEDVTASGDAVGWKIKGVYATGVNKNVTALPADGAVVTMAHTASSTYQIVLAWDNQAFVTAFAKLKPLATSQSKGTQGKILNIMSQVVSDGLKGIDLVRWDCLAGFMVILRNFVSRVDIKVS